MAFSKLDSSPNWDSSEWHCLHCTLLNGDASQSCSICGGDRMGAVAFDLLGYLAGLKMCISQVPGDGDCLYHTIVRSGLASSVRHLRRMVADYLEAHRVETEATLVDMSFSEFLRGIRGSEQADHQVIQAICDRLRIKILIHRTTEMEPTPILPKITRPNDAPDFVHILYNGSHYDLLVNIEEEQNDTSREDTMNDGAFARRLRQEEELDAAFARRLRQEEALDAAFARGLRQEQEAEARQRQEALDAAFARGLRQEQEEEARQRQEALDAAFARRLRQEQEAEARQRQEALDAAFARRLRQEQEAEARQRQEAEARRRQEAQDAAIAMCLQATEDATP